MTERPLRNTGTGGWRGVAAIRRFRARLAVAALVLLSTWEVMVLVSARVREPSAEDWRAVASAIPVRLDDDQLIVFAPDWIDPVGRLWLGDRLSIDHVARMDAVRYREIWEVSVRGASAPEVARESAVSERHFGPIRVRRFVRDAPTVTWSLHDGASICEVDFAPRRGLVFELHHALAQGRREFQQVSLGGHLQVYAGLTDYHKRSGNQSKAWIQVRVDGREVTRGGVGNDDGWVALPVAATPAGAHDVDIIVRVQDRLGPVDGLSVCVAAEGRTLQP